MPIKIDPATGERVTDGNAQIDPATGERVVSSPPLVLPTAADPQPAPQPHSWLQKEFPVLAANWHSNTDPQPWDGSLGGTVKEVGGAAARALMAPVLHPLDTIRGLATAVDPSENLRRTEGMGAMVMDARARPAETAMRGLGGIIGGALQGGVLGAGAATAEALTPYESPVIPASEMAARTVAKAIRPVNAGAYANVVDSLIHAPAIKDFAARTGNPLKTPLEFAAASRGLGDQAATLYKSQMIHPNEDVPLNGEGQPYTVAQAYKRIGDLNDLLRPAYRQATPGMEMSAEQRLGLKDELDALNDRLYSTLSERSGIPVEAIQRINRIGGSLKDLAGETTAAQNARDLRIAGYDENGRPIPLNPLQAVNRGIEYLRGGPDAVAARKLQGALGKIQAQPMELPSPDEIAAYRSMVQRDANLGELQKVSNAMSAKDRNYAALRARTSGYQALGHLPVETPSPDMDAASAALARSLNNRPTAQGKLFSDAQAAAATKPLADMAPVKQANRQLLGYIAKSKEPLSPNQPPRFK